MGMQLGPAGEKLIKSFEKLELSAYLDTGGVVTIGWGHTAEAGGLQPRVGMTITTAQAESLFLSDIAECVSAVNELVKVPLNQNQFDALCSWEFNTGALAKSTLLKLLNAGNYNAVPSEMLKWNKATVKGKLVVLQGLVNRRKAEVALFVTPTADEAADPVEARAAQDVEPPQPKGMAKSKTGGASIILAGGSIVGAATQIGPVLDGINSAADAVTKTAGSVSATVDNVGHTATAVNNTASHAAQVIHSLHLAGLTNTEALAISLGVLVVSAFIWFDRWRRMQMETR